MLSAVARDKINRIWDGAKCVVEIADAIGIAFAQMMSLDYHTDLTFVKFTILAFDLIVETCTEYFVFRLEGGSFYGF